MRRLIQIAVVALGVRAFLRWRKQRHEAAAEPIEPPADPAAELRQKLAESRDDAPLASEAEIPAPAAVEDRRREVHEQGRAAIDEMSSSDES